MNVIIGGRASGKTTQAILESSATGRYILAANQQQAKMIHDSAQSMSLDIPYPVTAKEIKEQRLKGSSIERDGLIVDEAMDVLQELLLAKITTATLRHIENTEDINNE